MIGGAGDCRTRDAFQPLGLRTANSESARYGIRDVAGTRRNGGEPQQHAPGMDRDVGHLSADLDQGDAQFPFLRRQAGVPGRNRCGDHGFHPEMGALHRFQQIADRRAIGQHDVDIDAEPFGMQPLGTGDAMHPVQRVMGRLGMQHLAPVGLDIVPGGKEKMFDVLVLDPPSADIDLDLGDLAGEPGARTADPDAADAGTGVAFRPLHRVADGMGGSGHVGDIAPLDAFTGAVTGAQHHEVSRFGNPHYHGGDAERPDVDGPEDPADAWRAHQGVSRPSSISFARPGMRP